MKPNRFWMEDCMKLLRREILPLIRDLCVKDGDGKPWLKVCGSLRRGLAEVGDIDVVYVSQVGTAVPPGELLPQPGQYLVKAALTAAVQRGQLRLRKKADGSATAGENILLTEHVGTGIPIDFYRATEISWWNVVLCRTGSAAHNQRLAERARQLGWKWHPGARHPGLEDSSGRKIPIRSEEEAYQLLGLPFLQPHERER